MTPAAPPETGTTEPNDTCSSEFLGQHCLQTRPAPTTNTGRYLLSRLRLDTAS